MGKTVYQKVQELLKDITDKEITLHELTSLITIHMGSTPVTISTALRTMGTTGLIKDIGNSRFIIVKNAE